MVVNSHYRKLIFSLLVVVLLSFSVIAPVRSEGGVSKIEIVQIDSTKFPEVSLQARVLDPTGLPVEEINPADFILTENNEPVEFTHRALEAGNQIVFILDCGAGVDSPGTTGIKRIDEMKSIVDRYITGMSQDDRVMIIQQVGLDTKILQDFTSDKTLLDSALTNLTLPPKMIMSYGFNAIQKGLDELKNSPGNRKGQSIVFLSTGVQNSVAATNSTVVIQYAKDLFIPIHTILSRSEMDTATAQLVLPMMQTLAGDTGGIYTYYKSKTDVDDLFERLNKERIQYTFTFRSKLSSNSDRSVQLTTTAKGNDVPRGMIKYSVTLQPPRIVIESPAGGQQFIRTAQQYNEDITGVEPTSATVAAHVEWVDKFPRRIVSAEYQVDNATHGTPLVEPGDTLNFNWDLRTYTTPGETAAQLRIKVRDELGLETLSDPISASVVVSIPPPPTAIPPAGKCDQLTGYELLVCRGTNLSGWFALALAVPTLLLAVLAYRKKETIVEGVKSAGSIVDQAWKRITQGPKDMNAAAYLQVLSEAHKPILGHSVPLYKGAPITIGRDPTTNRIPILETRQDTVISREHCTIQERDGGWFLKDMASTYGTFRDGVQLQKMVEEPLHDGDEISLGPSAYGGVRLLFRLAGADGSLPGVSNEDRITK